MDAAFKGIAFPFSIGETSFPEAVTDSDLIKHSIIQILLTERGERVMRPEFGSGMMATVFGNNDSMLKAFIISEVNTAIGRWEPRAIVRGVDVVQQDSTVIVTINFVVVATSQQDSVSLQLATPQ